MTVSVDLQVERMCDRGGSLIFGCFGVQISVEWPYVFVQALVYSLIVYSSVQFEWQAGRFLLYFFFMFFTLLYFTYWGMMCVAITPNAQIAAIVSSAFYGLWNLFSGFSIARPVQPPPPPEISVIVN